MIFVYIACICIVVIIIAVFLESYRELGMVRTTEYEVSADNELKGKKLVYISDYHETRDGRINDEIVRRVASVNPDAVLIGGDMLNANETLENPPYIELVNAIADKYPVYYALGNHEKKVLDDYCGTGYLWEQYQAKLSPSVNMLINEKRRVSLGDAELEIAGIDIPLEYYSRFTFPKLSGDTISEMVGSKDMSIYTVLLGHAPDLIDGYAEWGADLVLSGHFHGGIMRLPVLGGVISPRLRLFPKYDYGMYEKAETKMIVTGGLGQHSIKLRVNNIPEVVVVSFK